MSDVQYEVALLVGGPCDGQRRKTYPGQRVLHAAKISPLAQLHRVAIDAPIPFSTYVLQRVHGPGGYSKLIGTLETDPRNALEALVEEYGKGDA
jgi:hypothetical protein